MTTTTTPRPLPTSQLNKLERSRDRVVILREFIASVLQSDNPALTEEAFKYLEFIRDNMGHVEELLTDVFAYGRGDEDEDGNEIRTSEER